MILTLDFFKALALIGFFAVFYLLSIRETPIYDETEGQYAAAAKAMSSYQGIPMNNEIPRLQKPPLTYWLMRASSNLIGDHELAMRLPFVMGLLGLLAVTYAIGAEVMDSSRSCAAMVVMGSMLGLFVFGRMIMPEILFSLFLALTFWASIRALNAPSNAARPPWWTVAWLMMALACFTKGFHGLVWPLMVLGLVRALEIFQRESWYGFGKSRNFVLFLGITVPWYLWLEMKYPGFIQESLWNEQMGHALDFRNPPTYSRVSLLGFIGEHFFLLFPAILLIPHALISFEWTQDRFEQRRARKLLLLVPAVILLTSCFSARQDYYTMGCWFAVALLSVVGIDRRPKSRWLLFPFLVFALAGVLLLLAWKFWRNPGEMHFRSDTTDHFLSVLMNLPAELQPLLFWSGWTLIIGAFIGWFFWRRCLPAWIPLAWLLAMSGPLWGAGKGFRILSDSFSLKRTSLILNQNLQTTIVVDGPHPLASSLFYYVDRPIHFVRAHPNAEFVTRVHGVGRDRYWEIDLFLSHWKSGEPIDFIFHEKEREYWKGILGEIWFEVPEGRSGSRILVRNFQ